MSDFKNLWRSTARIAAVAALGVYLGAASLSPAAAAERPSYYPADYAKIVEASKKEGGLLIYSIMAEYNWRPVIEDFHKLYPWIKVSTLDLNSNEVFTRYYAEKSSGAKTTDLIVSATVDGWLEFIRKGEVMDYKSVESDKVPDWSKPKPGFYTVSTDPNIIVYNKLVVPENKRPKGIQHLAKLVKENPALFKNGLATYNVPLSTYGQAIYDVYLNRNGEKGWAAFDVIGPQTRLEMSAGPMLAKLASGEYKVAYFAGGVVVFPKMKDAMTSKVMGWSFIDDGTPLFMRMMAIPKAAPNVNSAKLMLDFILSHAGQAAFGRGGLTPYRSDVKPEEVAFFTYDSIKEKVGEENLLLITYDAERLKGYPAMIDRFKKAYPAK
jgi:iron(III) transport system substrate-binding protein